MQNTLVAIPGQTTPVVVGAVAVSVALRRGVVYRVVADVDIWINRWNTTATNADFYMPTDRVEYIILENADPDQAATFTVSVLAAGAGRAYFTPMIRGIAA
jgi:hypothetical protein